MLRLSSILAQAADSNSITVKLSPDSLTVILSALDYFAGLHNWIGADGKPNQAEQDQIDSLVSKALLEAMTNHMIGWIFPSVSPTVPANCLPCNGTYYQVADYPELVAVLDPFFIVGDGRFFTPNLGGRSVIGSGQGYLTGFYANYSFGGVEQVALTEAQMPNHSHSYYPPIVNLDLESPGVPDIQGAGISPVTFQTGSAGNGEAHENRSPYAAMPYYVVAR